MTTTELDAAQRVIESDSFLMLMFLKTPNNLPISLRINEVFKSQISHDQKALAEFIKIRAGLETKEEKETK